MSILNTGEILGQYKVQGLIKRNLYTETYRVEDRDGTTYFLKLFILKKIPKQLFNNETNCIKEIEYCQNLKHKNLASFISSGIYDNQEGNYQYYVTNYFNGELLVQHVNENGKLSESESLKIFRGILDGLDYLHTQIPVLCHNDLDPTNIILSTLNNNEPEIIDLGHLSNRCSGTVWFDTSDIDPLFHANETSVGIFDEQGDVFSACAILYFMLTGEKPWNIELSNDGDYKIKFRELSQYRKVNKLDFSKLDISTKLKRILEIGLQVKSTERAESVKDLLRILDSEESENIQNGNPHIERSFETEQHKSPNYVEFPIKKGNGKGFEDIAGMCELKDSLNKQVVFVIKNKEVAEEYKITPPNGMLLYGPPGCGKTFFAEKFAEETGFSYLLVKSSDLASSYVHGSQEKIRQLFDQAEKNSPIVVCFDEFDALVPDRSWNNVSSEEVNEFLSQMNNCAKRGIFIVATSNRPDKIDPAVLRTGRIDKMVYVPLPDFEARKEMFSLHLKGRPVEDGIDVGDLAKQTEGYIASDIAYIVNDSAMVAAFTRTKISGEHLNNSIKNTHPSVRTESLKKYDEIKKKMEDNNRRIANDQSKIVDW